MPRIATCPTCGGDISLADETLPESPLRCPLCQREFPASTALAHSVAMPPMAFPVEAPDPRISGAVGPNLSRPSAASAASTAPQVARHTPGPRPRKSRGPGITSQFVGIVGGGALGLAIGYLVLLRFGGERYDFLEVADRLPPWLVRPDAEEKKAEGKQASRPKLPQVNQREAEGPSLADLLKQANEEEAAKAAGQSPATAPDAPPADTANPAPPSEAAPMAPSNSGASSAPEIGPRSYNVFSLTSLQTNVDDLLVAWNCPGCGGSGQSSGVVTTGATSAVDGPDMLAAGPACAKCQGNGTVEMTPRLYESLCRLAEVVTFVEAAVDDQPSIEVRDRMLRELRRAASAGDNAETIGRFSGFRLPAARRETSGVALAGTVRELGQTGPLYTMQIVLLGAPQEVAVLSRLPASPQIEAGDRVLVLGSIVDRPAENLAGYSGDLAQAVWGGLPVKLNSTKP